MNQNILSNNNEEQIIRVISPDRGRQKRKGHLLGALLCSGDGHLTFPAYIALT